jgi:hypothetical protein
MPTKKINEIKRCISCGRLIRYWNKSGFCGGCFHKKYKRKNE